MKNKFKNKYVFYISNICFNNYSNFTINIIFRILKNKEDKKRFIEKLSFTNKKRSKGNLIWFHGASVGEILSIIPLIKHYEKDNSIKSILVTSSTLSSSKVLKNLDLKTIHQFYPIDHIFYK